MTPDIVFERSRMDYLLDLFGTEVDEEGYVVDASTGERVLSTDGDPLKADDLGVVGHGSEVLAEDDFTAIVDYVTDSE